jgi:hypothetical protein
MTVETCLSQVARKLAEIQETIEEIFESAHSVKFLFRSAIKGVDYARRAAKLARLEDEVHALGASFYESGFAFSSPQARLTRTYWCYVLLATSALTEWAEDLDREFREEEGYDRRERQFALRRYLDAIGRSKEIARRLSLDTKLDISQERGPESRSV